MRCISQSTREPLSRLGLLFCSLLLCPPSVAVFASSDWPGFRGPSGNGQLLAALPPGEGELVLELRWRQAIGSGYSGVALAGGIGVVGSSRDGRDVLLAFEPDSGGELWSADLGPLTVGAGGSKDGPIATPTIADGRAFMVSTQGRLLAVAMETGELLWSVDLVGDLSSQRPVYGFATSPVVAGGIVVVQAGGAQGALVGVDAATGELRWRAFEDRHYAQSPILTELAGRSQVVVMGSTKVAGLDPATGDELWSHEHGGAGEFGAESASPMPIGGDRLLVKHDNERTSVLQIEVEDDESLVALKVGESRTLTRSYSPPTVSGSSAYGYTSRFLSALDLDTSEELWRSRAPGDGFPIAIGDMLFVVTKNEGTAHLGRASRAGWSEVDQITLFEDLVWTPPSYSDGAFYVRSLEELARVDLVRREPNATTQTSSSVTNLPPELEALSQRIAQGADRDTEVAKLLADLEGPLVDGERVLFLWRGEAAEVGIAGDMFGFRYDEAMQRLAGTDLWWWQTELDRRGRFSYVYFPDYTPTLDPLNPHQVESTVMGPDLNHRAEQALQVSWFAMPEWPGLSLALADSDATTSSGSEGRLERFEVSIELPPPRGPASPAPQAPAQKLQVPVTVWLPPGYDAAAERRYPTVFSLERYAISIGDWPSRLAAAVASGRVEPLIGIMIDPPAGFYGRRGGMRVTQLVPDVLAEVERRFSTMAEPEGRAVVGALYTTPAALGLSLGEQRLFARVALQSPFVIDVMMPMYEGMVARAANAAPPTTFYVEWAQWDMRSPGEGLDLGVYMRQLHEFLDQSGYDVIGGKVWDSTDWAGWRNRTGLILEALFPAEDGAVPAELDDWLVASE